MSLCHSDILDLELHLGCVLCTCLSLELIHGVEAEDASEDILWELADDDIVLLYHFVELVAGLVNAVLGAFQLYLQVAEVLVGLQVGLVFLNGNQASEGSTQFALSLLELLQLLRSHVLGVEGDLSSLAAGADNTLQGLFLV